MRKPRIAIIGIGGYGREHVRIMAKLAGEDRISCAAFCEPVLTDNNRKQAELLTSLGAAHYTDYRVMLDTHPGIDAVVIATPLALHKPMFLHAMSRGIHVLTEKPPCVVIEDLDEMIEAARQSGQLAAVNFQNTSGQAFRKLLQLIREGAIGSIREAVSYGAFQRSHAYFERTAWAGKLRLHGEYVLDGPICNALSHLLNNCLVAAGGGDPRQAEPVSVQAELYRGNRIESEDTSCIRITAANGVVIHHYTSLCSEVFPPVIRLTGTHGSITWRYDNRLMVEKDGEAPESFTYPAEDLVLNMYDNLLRVLNQEEERLLCSIEDCRSFLLAANGAFTSSGGVHPLPESAIRTAVDQAGLPFVYIPALGELMEEAARQGKLFSELPLGWGVSSEPVSMAGYNRYIPFPS